jgi:hypothetical protein
VQGSVVFARDCLSLPGLACIEIPQGCPGVGPDGKMYGASRIYLDPPHRELTGSGRAGRGSGDGVPSRRALRSEEEAMFLLVAACTPDADPDRDAVQEPPGGVQTTPWNGPETVVSADAFEPFLTLDPYLPAISEGPVFDDFDGDGLIDILAAFTDGGPDHKWLQVLARGPFADAHVPRDAWVVTDLDFQTLKAAELTGDDQIDLIVMLDPDGAAGSSPRQVWGVPGPFDGSLRPSPTWMDLTWSGLTDHFLPDADTDGTIDLVWETFDEVTGEQIQIGYGPMDRWVNPPDVTITPMCRNGATYRDPKWTFWVAYFPGDLDGDGSAELVSASYGQETHADCGDFTLPLPSRGVVDPFTSELTIEGFGDHVPELMGDWNGDGLPELYDGWADQVLVSPVTITSDGVVGTSTLTLHPSLLDIPRPVFDLGPDGQPDALAYVGEGVVVVLPVELDELANPTATVGWELPLGFGMYPYVEEGHAWLAVASFPTYSRIDLGPAAPL